MQIEQMEFQDLFREMGFKSALGSPTTDGWKPPFLIGKMKRIHDEGNNEEMFAMVEEHKDLLTGIIEALQQGSELVVIDSLTQETEMEAKTETLKKRKAKPNTKGARRKVRGVKRTKPAEAEAEADIKVPAKGPRRKKKVVPEGDAKPAKKKAPEKKKKPVGVDALGGRLGTGVAKINKMLIDAKKPLTSAMIAAKCDMSTSRVSSHLATLASRGSIEKGEDGYTCK